MVCSCAFLHFRIATRSIWRLSGNMCGNKTSAERVKGRSADSCSVSYQCRWRGHGNISFHHGQTRASANPCSFYVPTWPDTCCVSKFGTFSQEPVRFFEGRIDPAPRTDGEPQMGLCIETRAISDPIVDQRTSEGRCNGYSPTDATMRGYRFNASCCVCSDQFSGGNSEMQQHGWCVHQRVLRIGCGSRPLQNRAIAAQFNHRICAATSDLVVGHVHGHCKHAAGICYQSRRCPVRRRSENDISERFGKVIGQAMGNLRAAIVDGWARADRILGRLARISGIYVSTRVSPHVDCPSHDRAAHHEGAARSRIGSREGGEATTSCNQSNDRKVRGESRPTERCIIFGKSNATILGFDCPKWAASRISYAGCSARCTITTGAATRTLHDRFGEDFGIRDCGSIATISRTIRKDAMRNRSAAGRDAVRIFRYGILAIREMLKRSPTLQRRRQRVPRRNPGYRKPAKCAAKLRSNCVFCSRCSNIVTSRLLFLCMRNRGPSVWRHPTGRGDTR